MKHTNRASISVRSAMLAFTVLALFVAPACATVLYTHDFQTPVGAEWSNPTISMTPSGRSFLGEFGNETTTLTLTGLSAHTDVAISFQLFVLKSWDGNVGGVGPDVWDLSVVGGPTLLHTTFANVGGSAQAYPGTYPGGNYATRTGAAESNTLGYTFYGDTVYNLGFTFAHTGDVLAFDFSGMGLQGISDESWGIDNIEVSMTPVPEPGTIVAVCAMLAPAGLMFRNRRKA